MTQFGPYLEQALRNCMVCGFSNKTITEHLLTKRDLTLAKAQELSIIMEAAEKQAQWLKETEPAVHHVDPPVPQSKCYCCGGTRHKPSECRFKQAVCHCRQFCRLRFSFITIYSDYTRERENAHNQYTHEAHSNIPEITITTHVCNITSYIIS